MRGLFSAISTCLLAVTIKANADTREIGEVLNVALPATAIYFAVKEDGNEGIVQFLKSAVVAELVTEGLKTAIDKERPNGSCCTAFPSGHATRAFYAATYIHERYGGKKGIAALALATVVAYTRVESDRHDVADVVGGAAVGYLAARYFTSPKVRVGVSSFNTEDGFGVTMTFDLD